MHRYILSIIIPVFNEARTIHLILNKIKDVDDLHGVHKNIIIVNDASSDQTERAINDYQQANPDVDITYVAHSRNQGKGAAIHTGIKIAQGDFIIIQDADLEYDPNDYSKLLQPVLAGKADVVFGSRYLRTEPYRVLAYWHTLMNKILTAVSNMFTNLHLTDMETCYKLFRAEVIKNIDLKEKRFGFEPEITAKIAGIKGIRIYEVGISYYGRSVSEGKKITWKDGVRALYCILKYNLFKTGGRKI